MARTQLSDRLGKTHTIDICRHGRLHLRSSGMPHALPWLARAHTPDALGLASDGNDDIRRVRADYPKVNEIPFSSERKMMTTVHQHGGRWVAYTKGAPEVVLAHCGSHRHAGQRLPLEGKAHQSIDQALEQLESQGMDVLALAQNEVPSPESLGGVEWEKKPPSPSRAIWPGGGDFGLHSSWLLASSAPQLETTLAIGSGGGMVGLLSSATVGGSW